MLEIASTGLVSPHQIGEMTPTETLKNVAPPQPVEDEASSWLMKLTRRLAREDNSTDRQFYRKWFKVAKHYEGEHMGMFTDSGQWRSYMPQIGDPYYIINEFRYHADSILSQWVQAHFDIRVLPANNADETVMKARAAAKVLDFYEEKILTEDFRQRECKFGMFTGQMYRYSYWDPTRGAKSERYEFEQQEQELGGGYYECPDCQQSGPLQELQGEYCPSCGSTNIQIEESVKASLPAVVKAMQCYIGEPVTDCVSAFQVKFDGSQGDFEKAQWLRRMRMLRPEFVKQVIPWWEPKVQRGVDRTENGLKAERMLQKSSGTASFLTGGSDQESESGVVVQQWWLAPSMYGAREPEEQDLKLGKMTIPAGTKLADAFPTGLYLLIIDEKLVDIREEYLHDHWQHTPFIRVPTRALGDGIEDLLEPNRQIEDINSLIYTDIKSNAAPPTLVNETYGVKVEEISGKAHYNVPVRVPPGESIDNAVRHLQGRTMGGHVFAYVNSLKGSMQILAKSFSSSTGAPDVADLGGINTATGAQLMATNAVAQRGPELALRAYGDVVWAKQIIDLFIKNATDEHYIPLAGRYGMLEGQYFKGADIDADFMISVRRRSWMPKNEMERRQDLLGALQAGLFSPDLPRSVRDAIAENFNISVDMLDDTADIRIARMRLEQMKQMIGGLGQQGVPPEQIVPVVSQQVPVEMLSDNHMVCIEWWRDWLKTDEGLQADQMLRECVKSKILEHYNAMGQQMALNSQTQMMAMGPEMQAQQQTESANQDREDARQGAQIEAQLMGQAMQAQAQNQKVKEQKKDTK